MDARTRRDIAADLIASVAPDGYDAEDWIEDLAAEYEVPVDDVRAVWRELVNNLDR